MGAGGEINRSQTSLEVWPQDAASASIAEDRDDLQAIVPFFNEREMRAVLPELYQSIAPTIGLGPLLKLSKEFGGLRLYLSRRTVEPTSPVARVIGIEAARALFKALGVGEITVPFATKLLRAARYKKVVMLRAQGMTGRAIAKAVAMGEREIWRILSESKKNLRAEVTKRGRGK